MRRVVHFLHDGRFLSVMCMLVVAPCRELFLFQKRQSPATAVTSTAHMLQAHSVPYEVVVGEVAPAAADLGGLAERDGIQVT